MGNLTRGVLRTCGVGNTLFGAIGLLLATYSLAVHKSTPGGGAYYEHAYYIRIFLSILFLSILTLSGFMLLRLDPRGLRMAVMLFLAELGYFLASPAVGLFLSLSKSELANEIGMSMGSSAGTGNIGLAPQIVIAYPLVGLLALGIVHRRLISRIQPSPPS